MPQVAVSGPLDEAHLDEQLGLQPAHDLVTISQWLGHASVTTTNRYATVDIEMKRKAIEQARPIQNDDTNVALWRMDASILKWLEEL